MTKLEAIKHLEESMKHMPKFRKSWKDYIELCIIEVFEEVGLESEATPHMLNKLSERLLRLFQADWWEAQGLK